MPSMSPKPELAQESSDSDKVLLKPILGVEPGIYLACIYAFVFASMLFGLLFLPGLLDKRSLVYFDSEPKGVAIKIDGAFVGATPFELQVSAGMHQIEYGLSGFRIEKRKADFGGSIFASLIFPKKVADHIELICSDPVRTLAKGASEFAAWAFAGEPTLAYQVPSPLSESAYRIAPALRDDITLQEKSAMILQEAARYASTEASLRDLTRATFLLGGAGLSSSPTVAIGAMSDMLQYLSMTADSSRWLAATLPQSASNIILSSSWFTAEHTSSNSLSDKEATSKIGNISTKPVTIASVTFNPVPKGHLATIDGVKRNIPVNSFLIAEKEITLTVWIEFLKANPEWEPGNTVNLLEKGLISENYMQEYSAPAYPKDAVSGISWFAAKAFCNWLQGQLPAEMKGFRVDLPTEIQWQYAAELDSIQATGFEGSLWEWCAEYFAPNAFLPAVSGSFVDGPERSIRGGSWINASGTVNTSTRASLPPSSCSPFVGFRPILMMDTGISE